MSQTISTSSGRTGSGGAGDAAAADVGRSVDALPGAAEDVPDQRLGQVQGRHPGGHVGVGAALVVDRGGGGLWWPAG